MGSVKLASSCCVWRYPATMRLLCAGVLVLLVPLLVDGCNPFAMYDRDQGLIGDQYRDVCDWCNGCPQSQHCNENGYDVVIDPAKRCCTEECAGTCFMATNGRCYLNLPHPKKPSPNCRAHVCPHCPY